MRRTLQLLLPDHDGGATLRAHDVSLLVRSGNGTAVAPAIVEDSVSANEDILAFVDGRPEGACTHRAPRGSASGSDVEVMRVQSREVTVA